MQWQVPCVSRPAYSPGDVASILRPRRWASAAIFREGGCSGGAARGRGPAPAAGAAQLGPAQPPAPGFRLPLPAALAASSSPPGRQSPLCGRPALTEAAMGPARWLALGSILALGALLEGRLVGQEDAGFGECDQFFYAETPPAGLAAEGHVKICQRSEGTERFATLYSTRDHIPVYSAFRAPRLAPGGAEERWLVEPQVSKVVPRPDSWAGLQGRFAATARGRAGKGNPHALSGRVRKRGFRIHPTAPPELQRTSPAPVNAIAGAQRSASFHLNRTDGGLQWAVPSGR